MLKLPKPIVNHPKHDVLMDHFLKTSAPLLSDDETAAVVSHWPLDEALRRALGAAKGTGHLVQGLEAIAQKLDREKKGLDAVRARTGQPPAHRLSRLVLISTDGSERFYREVTSLLRRHADRLWVCRLETTGETLGQAFTPKGHPTKALMIDDKQALVLTLLAFADKMSLAAADNTN